MHTVRRALAVAVIVLFFLAFTAPAGANKFEDELEKETAVINFYNEVQTGGYKVIGTAELKKWIDEAKKILIVDTMPYEASYKKEHIPGAKQFLFPIPGMSDWNTKETDGKSKEDYAALLGADKEMPIVIYCGFVKCTRSHNGALWAVKLGYKNVYRMPGGIFSWKGAGYPAEKVQ